MKVGMVSLGCSKNQVDAERLLAALTEAGYELCGDEALCDAVIVNTCGFIEDAKKEAIEHILYHAARRESGALRLLVVTGCLAERYQKEMAEEIPEIDVILGIGSNQKLVEAIRHALEGEKIRSFGAKENLALVGRRILIGAPYSAYLKIAEGCSNCCSFCAIPLIRGAFRSCGMEDVLAEARELAARGVTELNIVAQDTSRYGQDIAGKPMLPALLRRLCQIPGLHWIRLLYCYPQHISDELLEVMAEEKKIVRYMDIPLQHVSASVLSSMNRTGNADTLREKIANIRAALPGVALRTTLLAGYPGETEQDFEMLCDFMREMRFERLGCFAYSQEEGTPAANMPGQIPEELRRHRADIIMETQMGIAAKISQSMVGKTLEVLCEGRDAEQNMYVGRSYMDAPDIDTKVFFHADRPISAGEYCWVVIREACDYDLIGRETAHESAK
jgi:ribosomal protein S12 methylthiotransferase RimO